MCRNKHLLKRMRKNPVMEELCAHLSGIHTPLQKDTHVVYPQEYPPVQHFTNNLLQALSVSIIKENNNIKTTPPNFLS